MERNERQRMLENKQAFVAALGIALREFDDKRSDVKSVKLEVYPSIMPGADVEQLRIEFLHGGAKMIPAEGNSNLANMLAVAKALL